MTTPSNKCVSELLSVNGGKAPASETNTSNAALDKICFANGGIPVAEARLKLHEEMQDHVVVYTGGMSRWRGEIGEFEPWGL